MTTAPRLAPEWTPPERPASETREQLLAAAERLFAERGFGGVSVRMIAAEAGVNWSLVGYHFRGKDGLLAEVYRRHCATLNGERLKLLADARRAGLQLESVIEAFVRPALAEIQGPDNQSQFSRLRGMLAAENAPLFTQLVADNFDQSSRTFVAALRECLPGLTADEILWRFHFMLGTIYYSASSPAAHQGVLAWTLRSGRSGGDRAAPGAVPGGGVPVPSGHDRAHPRDKDQVAPMTSGRGQTWV